MFNFNPQEWWKAKQLKRRNMIISEREDMAYLKRICDVSDNDHTMTAIHKIVVVLKRLRGEKE